MQIDAVQRELRNVRPGNSAVAVSMGAAATGAQTATPPGTGKPKVAKPMRDEFPTLAGWVDAMREAFGREAGGRLTAPDGRVVEWGVVTNQEVRR